MIKNSQPFVKKFLKTADPPGGGGSLTYTVRYQKQHQQAATSLGS